MANNNIPNIVQPNVDTNIQQFSTFGTQPSIATPPSLVDIGAMARSQFEKKNPYVKNEFLFSPIFSTPTKDTLRYNDPSIGYSTFNPDIEQDYADKQSWYEGLGKNMLGFGTRGLATFLGGFSDIPDTVEAVGTQSLDAFTNTTWKNELSDWAESFSDKFPVYETRYTADHPWLSFVNPLEFKSFTNRWGTVANNLGFTAGAIANAVVTDIAVGALTGGVGEIALMPKQALTISKSLLALGKSFEAGKTAANMAKILAAPKNILNEIRAIGATNKALTTFRTGLNTYNSAVGQASIEGFHNFKETKDKLIDEYTKRTGVAPSQQEILNIEENARAAGNATLLANTGLLMATNFVTFGNLLKPTSVALREAQRSALGGAITRTAGQLDDVALATRSTKLMDKMLRGLKKSATQGTIRNMGVEGFEEGAQYTISESAKDFWSAKYKGSDDADLLFKSISKGVQNTLFTREGMENIVMGALSGPMISGFSSLYNRGRARVRGEKYEPSKNKLVNQVLESVNNTAGLTGSIFNQHNELSTAMDIQKRMEKAVAQGDVEAANNLKSDAFFNWIYQANKNGLFDLRMEALDDAKKLSDEEFANFWGIDFSQSNSKTASAYIDMLKQKALQFKEVADTIDTAFQANPYNYKKDGVRYHAYENYKQALAHSLMEVKDSEQRMTQVTNEFKNILPNADLNTAMNLTNARGIMSVVDEFTDKINNLKTAEANAQTLPEISSKLKAEREFLERQVKTFNDYLDGKRENTEDFKEAYRKTLNYLNNPLALDSDIAPLTMENTFEQLYALNHLKKRSMDAMNYYNTLRTKEGYEKFNADVHRTIAQQYYKRLQIKDGKLYIRSQKEVTEELEALRLKQLDEKQKLKETLIEKEVEEAVDLSDIGTLEDLTTLTAEQQNVATSGLQKVENGNRTELTKEEEEALASIPNLEAKAEIVHEVKKKFEDDAYFETKVEQEMNSIIESAPPAPPSAPIVVDDSNPMPSSIENLLGNVFEHVETDEQAKALNEFIKERNKVEDKQTKYTSKTYTNFVLNSPIFKFIFGDKLKATSISITLQDPKEEFDVNKAPAKIKGTNLYRRQSSRAAVINVNGQQLGRISDSNDLMVLHNNAYVPMSTVIDTMTEEEYVNFTKNRIDTFNEFKAAFKAYDKMSNDIFSKYKKGEKVEIPQEDVIKMLKLVPTVVNAKYTNKPEDSTVLKDIKALGENSYIISARRVFKKKSDTGEYTHTHVISVIGKDGKLTKAQIEADPSLFALMENEEWRKRVLALNSRYALLNRQPDGKFSKISLVAARPVNLKDNYIDDIFNTFKGGNIEDILALTEKLYIADSSFPKGSGLSIKFRVDINGNVNLDIDKRDGADVANVITVNLKDVVDDSDDVDQFLDNLNAELMTQNKDLGINPLVRDNFKKYIKDDDKVKFSEFMNTLSVSTTPYFYNQIKLTALPKDFQSSTTSTVSSEIVEKNTSENLVESNKIRIFGKDYEPTDTVGIAKAVALQNELKNIIPQLENNNTITRTNNCK